MIKTRIYHGTGGTQLCETYSDIGSNIINIETENEYEGSAIDAIAGYDDDGNPYSDYHYTESENSPNVTPEDMEEELEDML